MHWNRASELATIPESPTQADDRLDVLLALCRAIDRKLTTLLQRPPAVVTYLCV
jgi:hypothetical protein